MNVGGGEGGLDMTAMGQEYPSKWMQLLYLSMIVKHHPPLPPVRQRGLYMYLRNFIDTFFIYALYSNQGQLFGVNLLF